MSDDKKILLEKVREFEERTGHTVDSFPDDPNNTAAVLKERRYLSEPLTAEEAKKQMFARSRRSFLVGGVAALTGILGWRWMPDETKANLLRRTFEFNERVSQIFYSPKRLAHEFRPDQITEARVNSDLGISDPVEISDYRLIVRGLTGSELSLTLDDIKHMPRTEMITEFKCIEGWSYIAKWAGVRVSDLVASIAPGMEPQALPKYVAMNTPDEQYFVGWDTPAVLHPQTLLAYELNDAPLTQEHGAPLRIASPNKYGIKQIKRVGRIEFTNDRPRDFWALSENGGYDWYSGH